MSNRLNILILLVVTFAIDLTLNAQEQSDMSLEMAGALIANDRYAIQLNKITNKFPKIKFGSELNLYGSFVNGHDASNATVIFQSIHDKLTLQKTIETMLRDNQWISLQKYNDLASNSRLSNNVKSALNSSNDLASNNVNSTMNFRQSYCHNTHGRIYVNIFELLNSSIASLNFTPHYAWNQKCEDNPSKKKTYDAIDSIFPTLVFPNEKDPNYRPGQSTSAMCDSASNGGSHCEKSTQFNFETVMGKFELYEKIINQMNSKAGKKTIIGLAQSLREELGSKNSQTTYG